MSSRANPEPVAPEPVELGEQLLLGLALMAAPAASLFAAVSGAHINDLDSAWHGQILALLGGVGMISAFPLGAYFTIYAGMGILRDGAR